MKLEKGWESAVMGDKKTLCKWLKFCDKSEELYAKMRLNPDKAPMKDVYGFFQERLNILARDREGYTIAYCDIPFQQFEGNFSLYTVMNHLIDRRIFSLKLKYRALQNENYILKNKLKRLKGREEGEKSKIDEIKKEIEDNKKTIEDDKDKLRKVEQMRRECDENDRYVFYRFAEVRINDLKEDLETLQKSNNKCSDSIKRLQKERMEIDNEAEKFKGENKEKSLIDLEKKIGKEKEKMDKNSQQIMLVEQQKMEWENVSEEALNDTEQSIYLLDERCRKLIGNYENNDRLSGEIFLRNIDKEFLTKIVQMFWTDEALKNLKEDKWEKFNFEDRKALCCIMTRMAKEGFPWYKYALGSWGEEDETIAIQKWLTNLRIKILFPGYHKIRSIILELIQEDVKDNNPIREMLNKYDRYIEECCSDNQDFIIMRDEETFLKILQQLDQNSDVIEAFDGLLKKLKEEEELHKQKEWNNLIEEIAPKINEANLQYEKLLDERQ